METVADRRVVLEPVAAGAIALAVLLCLRQRQPRLRFRSRVAERLRSVLLMVAMKNVRRSVRFLQLLRDLERRSGNRSRSALRRRRSVRVVVGSVLVPVPIHRPLGASIVLALHVDGRLRRDAIPAAFEVVSVGVVVEPRLADAVHLLLDLSSRVRPAAECRRRLGGSTYEIE